MKYFVLVLLVLSQSVNAALTTAVDKTKLSNIEELKLTINADNISQNTLPDLAELEKDFIILGRSQQQSINIVNGQRSSRISWVLLLEPKRAGALKIPVLQLGKHRSKAIDIEVYSIAEVDFSKNPFFLKAEVSHKNPHVQEQVVYTISLYTQHRADISLNIPLQISDAIIEPLNLNNPLKQTSYQGKNVWVKAYHYAIFPQTAGELIIPRIKQGVQLINNSTNQRQSLLLFAPAITLSVQPIAKEYPVNQHWLPATNVELSAKFITNPPVFKVGEVVEREIVLTVAGQSKHQLPELKLSSTQAFEQYADTKQLTQTVASSNIITKLHQKMIIIPNHSGKQRLPELQLHWFDTQSQTTKVATLPAQSISVLAGSIDNAQIKNQPVAPKISKSVVAELPQEIAVNPQGTMIKAQYNWLAIYGLLTLWLLTLSGCYFKHNKKAKTKHKDQEQKQKDEEKVLLAEIKNHSQNSHSKASKKALNQWALYLGFININELAKSLEDKTLLTAINVLDRAIYQQQNWDGMAFYQVFFSVLQTYKTKPSTTIVSLYPQPLKSA